MSQRGSWPAAVCLAQGWQRLACSLWAGLVEPGSTYISTTPGNRSSNLCDTHADSHTPPDGEPSRAQQSPAEQGHADTQPPQPTESPAEPLSPYRAGREAVLSVRTPHRSECFRCIL